MTYDDCQYLMLPGYWQYLRHRQIFGNNSRGPESPGLTPGKLASRDPRKYWVQRSLKLSLAPPCCILTMLMQILQFWKIKINPPETSPKNTLDYEKKCLKNLKIHLPMPLFIFYIAPFGQFRR